MSKAGPLGASAAGHPLVTVSIVSHGDGAQLEALLHSLAHHEASSRLQLVVTDNLGRDLPNLDPSPWHSLTLVRNDRPAGYAQNHNAAFVHCEAEYFCVVNPDIRFVEPVLASLIESILGGDAIVSPLIVDSSGVVQDSFRSLPSPLELVRRRLRTFNAAGVIPPDRNVMRADWIAGIFMLFQRQTFARLNGFDSHFYLYFEDVDLCTRAGLLGLTTGVNTRVRVQHDARRASRRPGKYLLWHLQSGWRFFTSGVYRRAVMARGIGATSR